MMKNTLDLEEKACKKVRNNDESIYLNNTIAESNKKKWAFFYVAIALLLFWIVSTYLTIPNLFDKALSSSLIITLLILNRAITNDNEFKK